ncbi:MAG: GIY-YIG nuclease family protein [Clostridia bacterium]|nr:GIY-YIG nuclease family protein [Clostridia bacterium]
MEAQSKKEIRAAYKERKVTGGICAIKNTCSGRMLLAAVADLQGYRNRFEFSKATGGCINIKLQKDWDSLGADAFAFEVLEELVKKEAQTSKEFLDDIATLKEMWLEKLDPELLY